MTPLWCPICGREALEVAERREMASAAQSTPANDSDILVCHCADGHRFVMFSHAERFREPPSVAWVSPFVTAPLYK
jgi:hypothetical protein